MAAFLLRDRLEESHITRSADHSHRRASRRGGNPAHQGGPPAVSDVAKMLTARDEIDRTRKASPLYAAEDAVVIDTTGKTIEQVVDTVLAVVEERLKAQGSGLKPPKP